MSAISAPGAGKAGHEHRRQQCGERGWGDRPYRACAQVLPAEEASARHDGDPAPGTPVPPERTLAAEFDTSRTTVRQALQELVVEGRLERIQGKGTFVAKPKVSQALQLTSYTEDMRAQGLEPTSQLLDVGYITADDTLAGLLDITAGGRVLRIERLRMANGEPMAIETTHLSAKRFPALRRSLVKYTSLYTALAEVYDVHLAEAEETIETSLATPREAGLLGTDVGLPMLMLSRHSLDKDASRWSGCARCTGATVTSSWRV